MEIILIAAMGGVTAVGGFLAGVRYSGRRLPHLLATATPEQLRQIARATNRVKRGLT